MLDRSKVMQELQRLTDKLFPDTSLAYDIVQKSWQRIVSDSTFLYKVKAIKEAPWPVPCWTGAIDQAITVTKGIDQYTVASIDGSQIYPDRHRQAFCFLINIGSVVLSYDPPVPTVYFNSIPYLFSSDGDEKELKFSADLVDCYRQKFELQMGLSLSITIKKKHDMVLLFDGSLIFWHLAAKDVEVRKKFLVTYNALLYQLYQERIPMAGYISLPKSKELVNLVRLELCSFNTDHSDAYAPVNNVVDSTIARLFLKPYERSIVFQNRSKISKEYPDQVVPHFFYIHVGTEVGRVEIPAWIAHDEKLVSLVARVVLDQSIKGHGYPVALAEAHEQAVVKGADREFFYQALQKIGMKKKLRPIVSQKNLRKRKMSI